RSVVDMKQLRQGGSLTAGHSEHGRTPGVEATTGPLGQGVGNAVGMALAAAHLGQLFNRPGHAVIDHDTYFLASDGDLMEGVSHEACSLAGHLKLGKLIGLYDDNRITIDGTTDLTFSDDTARRFESYGWHVERVADGNDLGALDAALAAARRQTDRPSLVIVRTHIAYGSPHKQDSPEAHVAPTDAQATRAASGKVLNALAAKLPELIGGSADLAGSSHVVFKNGGDVAAGSWGARNVHFGVREHAMGAILNGLALHGGVRPV